MKILALEREYPNASATTDRSLLQAEAAKAWELYKQGIIQELYFNADQHTAVLVLECKDLDSARQLLAQLPLVQERLIDFELIPLVPYDGFERLFGSIHP
jgi:muconolactone delta-isomerase